MPITAASHWLAAERGLEPVPCALVKHPLYTGVALLVLPWAGFLLNTWLGVVIGIVLYVASRLFSPEEEQYLSQRFGPAWEAYRKSVAIPWL